MSLTQTVPHRPYTGSCKAFLDGLEVGQSRNAESRKQAVAVYHVARMYGWTEGWEKYLEEIRDGGQITFEGDPGLEWFEAMHGDLSNVEAAEPKADVAAKEET